MGFARCIDRSVVVGFCPTAPYFLAGSAASAIDLNFSTSSVLEVFKVDFSTPPPELPLAGVPIAVGERFHSVAWGKTGIDTKVHPLGLVAGGLEDGSVNLWDPNRIIQGSDANRCTVAKLKKHNSAVRALDFNPNLTQFLATGSTEPELSIWDLTKPSIPVSLTSARLPGVPSGMESDFTCTKWNEKVHQILASCTTNGKTIVQDMRRMKPVATLHDMSSSRRCSVLEWSPERPTQVLVASEDDRTPTVQVWDLRNSASPLSELAGHSKGILSMSWSPHDPRLLLTCAKDSKTYCWDVQTASIVSELPPLGAWHLYVQWSPITPGLFSVASFDGKIGICSFSSMTGPPTDAYGTTGPLAVVPKWMERPCGLSFGFGGKLATVSHSEKQVPDATTGAPVKITESKISIKQIALEAENIPPSETFDAAIRSQDRDQLSDYCRTKKGSSVGEDKETWEMLSLMFSSDAKRQLLTHLGFEDIELPQPESLVENGTPTEESVGFTATHQDSGVNAALDFFENLPDEGSSPRAEPKAAETTTKRPEVVAGVNEDEIQKALLVRSYDAAVESCLKAKRDADALIIAHVAGPAVFQRVMTKYMEQHPKPFMSLLSAVASNDFYKLIQSRNVAQWKETLAMLVAYIDDSETWGSLCDALGLRLYQSGNLHGASLCFVCSGNVEKAVGVWASQGVSSLTKMQDVIQKAFILACAVPQQQASHSLCTLVHNYAQILASQGTVQTALEYLDLVPGEPTESIQILRDRIYGSGLVAEPEQTWPQQSSYATPQPAVPDYGYEPYQPQPTQSYHEGYSGAGFGMGYAQDYPTAQPSAQTFPPPQQTAFQPSMPTQAPSLFTPTVPAPGLGTGHGMPSPPVAPPVAFQPTAAQVAPPPAFQPTAAPVAPPSTFQPTAAPPSAAFKPAPAPMTPTPPQQQPVTQQPYMPTAAPQTQPHVFTPMTATQGGVHAPGSPVRPPTPPSEPVPPHDITAQNADTSNVPAQFKPIVTHLKALCSKFEAASAAPTQKRIVADASKRIGLLFWALNRHQVHPTVAEKVLKYAQALSTGDTATATKILEDLTETAWDEASSHWLSSFKRLIRLAQTIK